jgi:hypothetical protein
MANMGERMVLVGIANEGEKNFKVDELKTWNIDKIIYFSDIVYFKFEDTYFSMKRIDFKEIFNK